jgi:hypothetical protein
LEGGDGYSVLFQPHIVVIGQVIGLPPRPALALTGQGLHPVEFGVGYLVEVTEIADIPESSALPGLHPADLARGAQETLGYLFYREAFFVAARAEQGAEFPAAKRRAVHFWHLGRFLSQESVTIVGQRSR